MTAIKDIRNQLQNHIKTIQLISDTLAPDIERCSNLLVSALHKGNKLLVMGNGGSAADAQHMAAEFVGRFLMDRKALPGISLTTDTSIITAVGNDYGFDEIFKRQVEALAQPGDVVIGISTSGYSNNVYQALVAANEMGCKTIGLLGRDGGNIAGVVDVNLTVPVQETPRIQESHLTIIHILCDLVERNLFGRKGE